MESTSNNTSTNENVELGALWKRKSKNGGQTYLAGHIKVGAEETPVKLVVFSNKHKNKETQPDFRIYESKPYDAAASTATSAQSTETAAQSEEDLI